MNSLKLFDSSLTTPQGFYDANELISLDVTELQQSLAVQPGPILNGMPTYSGPFFPELHASDPKHILGSGQLDEAVDQKVRQLLENANRNGMDVQIQEGYRSPEEQARLYNSGAGVTNAKPGQSLHQHGLAADIVFNNKKGQPSWSEAHNWNELGKYGKEVGLEWGGDWQKRDRPHFQLKPHKQTIKP